MLQLTRLNAHYSHCCDQNGSVAAECAVQCGCMQSEVVCCGQMWSDAVQSGSMRSKLVRCGPMRSEVVISHTKCLYTRLALCIVD